jgi:sigma-B regulation protein RsbU (phosphoserine phosphatase)
LLRSAGVAHDLTRLEEGGTVIGLVPIAMYEEQSLKLEKEDLLIAYTDGISEAMNENDEEWGEERMLSCALAVRQNSAEEILRAVFGGADRFTGNAPPHDDMTLLVLKID